VSSFWLDDVTLGDPQDVVARDVQSVLNLGNAVGLNLNIAKCEIITNPDGVVTDLTLLSFVHIESPDAELLGLHFFPNLLWMQLGQGDAKISPEQSTD